MALGAVAAGTLGAASASTTLPSHAALAERTVEAQPVRPAAGHRHQGAHLLSRPAHRDRTPRQIAARMLRSFGWRDNQFRYLNWLWDQESGWNVYATNPSSGAYGIPQAVPAAKMASSGPDWQSDAATQIRWGLSYILGTYGSPRQAWEHELATGWY
jgi:hypothetical protein